MLRAPGDVLDLDDKMIVVDASGHRQMRGNALPLLLPFYVTNRTRRADVSSSCEPGYAHAIADRVDRTAPERVPAPYEAGPLHVRT